MTASAARAELASALTRASEECQATVSRHAEHARPGGRFERRVLFALAALAGCSAGSALEDADVRLVRSTCDDAAATCRTEVPDACLSELVERLDAVVRACGDALGEPPRGEWQRFLFDEAEVEVMRAHRRWLVRGRAGTVENPLLDVALESVCPGSRRIAAMTVQILDWFERGR